MAKILDFLVLPTEITAFERNYLARVNRITLIFFALHVPVFTLIAWLNGTGPALALLLTMSVLGGPALAHYTVENPRSVSVIHGVTAMFMGGLLVHLGQGPVQIEMHFYFFALIAMCAVFGNPLVILAAALTVALHHFIVWLVLPKSVFNYDAGWWVVGVHAAFVALDSAAACFISRSFFDNVIGLEKVVQARTEALDSKNRDMRLLLDNVQQGFLTIDRAGYMARERSAAVDAWFGAPAPSESWFEYLRRLSPHFAQGTRLAWDELVAGIMPIELTLEQMPHHLVLGGAHYRFGYRPLGAAEPYQQFLVIITDVTTDVLRERAELEQREALALFERAIVDRSGLEGFFRETSQTVDILVHRRSSDASVVKRLIHTLKGNAALYGLQSIADRCHSLENLLAEESAPPPAAAYVDLRERWDKLAVYIEKLLGTRLANVELDEQQYAALEAAARSGEAGSALLRRVRGLKLEATLKRLEHLREQAKRIVERLDKGDIQIEVEDHGVRLDPRQWTGFWAAFVHALRNALDHGIEPARDRVAAGKTALGTVTLRTREDRDRLVIEIADDGRGIDWPSVAKRAVSAGLPTATALDLEQALFVDGISTATSITDVSGRGVGMGALLAATQALGGDVSVESTLHEGTTLRFSFPHPPGPAPDTAYPHAVVNCTPTQLG